MKKLIYCAAALAAMIFASSCQQENLEPVAQGNTVTYTVELPDVQTKAIGDASTVDQLIYEVWKTETADERDLTGKFDDGKAKATRLYQDQTALVQRNGKTCAVVTFNLVQDQEYTILFWAQKSGTGVYNTEKLTDVHYAKGCEPGSSEYFSNQENYAAFYAAEFVSDEDMKSRTVILKRPFAQLNIATKNTVEDYTVELNSSRVVISSVATHFNVAQNLPATPAVGQPVSFDFTTADVPTNPAKITVNGQEYDYVAMNYVFANGNAIVSYEINTTLYSHSDANTQTTAQIKNTVPNVPLKENYRTNIVGNLLSSTTEYYIEIDDSWYDEPGDGTEVEVWDGLYAQEPYWNETEQQYEISLASELTWLSHRVNGTLENPKAETKNIGFYAPESFNGVKFVLKENIDLQGVVWTPIGTEKSNFNGDFDGNGKTISNFSVNAGDKAAGLFGYMGFGSIKNLTISNAVINGTTYAGALVGWVQNPGTSDEKRATTIIENCVARNVAVTTVPNADKDNGAKAGGLVGYAVRTKISGCAVEYSDVSAYRDCGGLLGMANSKASVVDNTVNNVNVVANQACEYKTADKEFAYADEIIGRISADAGLIEGNTATNTSVVVKVNTAANLQKQANETNEDINIEFGGDITGNAKLDQRGGIDININGAGKKYNGTITIDGNSNPSGVETVLIKNVKFETTDASRYFVEMNSTSSDDRYAHNITIEDCTFAGTDGAVGARFRQCYNITFKNCEVKSGHSLAQLYGCDGVVVEGCNINAKNGVSFGTSTGATISNSTIISNGIYGYGVRVDADGERSATINNSTIKAGAPVLVRKATEAYTMNVTGTTTLESTEVFDVIVTSTDYDYDNKDNNSLAAPTGAYKLNLNSTEYVVFPDVEYYPITPTSDFKKAMADDQEKEILLMPGTYTRTIVMLKNGVTLRGMDDATVHCINLNGKANVTIKDVTFDAAGAKLGYDGSGKAKQYANIITGDNTNKPIIGALNLVINNCNFVGTFANGGAAIAFTDQSRSSGGSGNVTIKKCTFNTVGGYYDIYAHYTGNGLNGYGDFVIENNTFKTTFAQGLPVYLGRYASSTPVVVKGNTFETVTRLDDAVYVQDHSNYGVSVAAENNTFAN